MSDQQELLTAKVKAVNKANKYANELKVELVSFFKDYVGKKIFKADGTLLAKIVALAPKFENSKSISVYHRSSFNSQLSWVIKTCEPLPLYTCLYPFGLWWP
jgi:predicted RecB family endonuclease